MCPGPRIIAAALALLAAAPAHAQEPLDSVGGYSSPALAALIADASQVNARIPTQLLAYRARVETEMSIIILDSAGRERTAQLEQIASDVRFRSPDRYDQRVVGHRSQAVGPMFSLMSIFGGWTTPTLYGNRLRLGVTSATASNTTLRENGRGLAIHPLAANRDAYYRYAGGDTAVTLFSTSGRRIPVASVRVTPRADAPGDAILFFGDMQLDADRKQIVRMRGRMVEVREGRQTLSSGSRLPGATGASFVELVNVEVNGEYWLPAYQRTELQARIALFGELRTLVRIISRFHDYRVNDSSWTGPEAPPGVRHHLSFASRGVQERFNDWHQPLGAASTDVYYGDFDDLAPEAWRTVGSATGFRFRPRSLSEVFRFNRIEGLYTGVAAEYDFRDAAPGLSVRGSAGWAWAEGVARGMAGIQRTLGRTTTGVRLERLLAHTNDFQLPFTWGATLSAIFGSRDDFDYLDRRTATAFIARALGAQRRSLAWIEIGPGSDKSVQQNISRGLYVEGDGFRPNRGIRPGSYFRTAAALELNPQVSGMFVDRGVGARVYYERADGSELRWQRLELRAAARRELGPFQVYARGDAGTLLGSPAPQVLFEIGGAEGLSGYGYKEFAGDRAALGRLSLGYNFPFLRAPIRLGGGFIAPGIAPGIAAGIHGGWTEISGPSAQRALLELSPQSDDTTLALRPPISRTTDGIRASAELLLTFFSGAVSVGVARPVDRAGAWKITGKIGQGF